MINQPVAPKKTLYQDKLMKVQTTREDASGIRIQTIHGTVTTKALLAFLKQLYACAEFESGAKTIWNFRCANLEGIALPEVVVIRDFIEQGIEKRKPSFAALVVSKGLAHSLSSMFGTLIRSKEIKAKVFFDIETAKHWLNSSTHP